jgi:hypothetical protein
MSKVITMGRANVDVCVEKKLGEIVHDLGVIRDIVPARARADYDRAIDVIGNVRFQVHRCGAKALVDHIEEIKAVDPHLEAESWWAETQKVYASWALGAMDYIYGMAFVIKAMHEEEVRCEGN